MTLPSESNEWSGNTPQMARFLGALTLGLLGAALASGIYYGLGAWTGYRFRWIIIVSGLLVGYGVHLASRPRGGLGYQALAMLLTYAAIVSTHVPEIRESVQQVTMRESVTPSSGSSARAKKQPSWETLSLGQRALVVAVTGGIVLGLAVTAPFPQGNVLELIVLACALFTAWKLNQRKEDQVTGPLEVAIRHNRR